MIQSNPLFKRVIWIILDGVGAGEFLESSGSFQSPGANTLKNLARHYFQTVRSPLRIPHLQAMGLANLIPMEGISPVSLVSSSGAFGLARELSHGKDTTTGHWEMVGLHIQEPFHTYPNGFPESIVQQWIHENDLPGVLGNCVASGIEILERFGEEHLNSKKPILYTSGDSVWQVAAHETFFGSERLDAICRSARILCDSLNISRVISRPFIGDPRCNIPFQRTYHRKDYGKKPLGPTHLDYLTLKNIPTLGIGKIADIFSSQGIDHNITTHGNTEGLQVLLQQLQQTAHGLIFCNLIDFDMLYGHRRDPIGFGKALEEFDQILPILKQHLHHDDLLIINADHGNDPTYPGTDHTREYSPILAYTPLPTSRVLVPLSIQKSFANIGATVVEALTHEKSQHCMGASFLTEWLNPWVQLQQQGRSFYASTSR